MTAGGCEASARPLRLAGKAGPKGDVSGEAGMGRVGDAVKTTFPGSGPRP